MRKLILFFVILIVAGNAIGGSNLDTVREKISGDFDDDRWRMGLRGKKCWVWEGGIRVPFIIRWPEKFKGGRKIDTIAAHIDFMPTLLEACNIKPSQDIKFDGISLMPLLQGEEPGKAKRGDSKCVIKNMNLPKGAAKLEAWLVSKGPKYGVYSIALEYME